MSHSQGGENAGAGPSASQNAGLFAALKNIAATLLATGRTRFELLSTELEEEKLRAVRLLLMAQAMVFCLGVATLLLVGLLALLFWDNKVVIVSGFAALFLILGGVFYKALSRATQRSEPAFAASLAELEEDLRQLKAAARDGSTTH